jgi:predicted RNA-binding protein YlxR (DUF448 family)
MTVKSKPQRMCVGCREFQDKKELMRIVRSPEGEIFIDPTGKKNGRGAYLCFDEGCLQKAIKSKSLEKSLKNKIPEEVVQIIREQIAGDKT